IGKAPSSEKKPQTTSQPPAPNVSSVGLDSAKRRKSWSRRPKKFLAESQMATSSLFPLVKTRAEE
ncbi:hypothetical protein A2U01_0108650, partial [Trifolium medium]|nr:hypothetical protein [Trifolium medium]